MNEHRRFRRESRRVYWNANDRSTYRCPDCGRRESHPHISRLEVHHIDGNPEHTQLTNLVALCRHCHTARHGGQYVGNDVEEWKYRLQFLSASDVEFANP